VASKMSAYERKGDVEGLSLQNHQFDCSDSSIFSAFVLVVGTFDGHSQ
jgi:hypothetical protein